MARLLPEVIDLEAYRRLYRDASAWMPAMREICVRHGLDVAGLEMAPPGSHVVFWAGPNRLIKLFYPLWSNDAVSEGVALTTLTTHPEIPVPRVIADGDLEGWLYLILEPRPGKPLNQVWDRVEARDRRAICWAMGRVMAALHAVPLDGLDAIAVDWPTWLAKRRSGFAAAQSGRGASPEWIETALAFLDHMWPEITKIRPVLLNADITDEHVLLQQDGGRWHMSGLIDFGDAMLGDALYEFTAPLVFIAGGDPTLRQALMRGYGYAEPELDDVLSRRLMAMALLHQFADLPLYLRTAGNPSPHDMGDLQAALWSFPAV